MATGACGINCDVCRLNLLGLCTTCGAGTSPEADIKLAAQKRVLGSTCAILSCCSMNRNGYCLRDCSQFPCENHTRSTYPFGAPFLEMQARRRRDWMPRHDPLGRPVTVPPDLWDALDKRNLPQLMTLTLAEPTGPHRFTFPFMDLTLGVDLEARQLMSATPDGGWEVVDIPLLTLVVLSYFTRIDRLFPMGKELIATSDMDRGNYFSGQQQLIKEPLLRRFAGNRKDLERAAACVGGVSADFTDAAFVFSPFPRLALYYLFRDLDSVRESRLSILFDRPIQTFFTPPLVWELVNLANTRLLCA